MPTYQHTQQSIIYQYINTNNNQYINMSPLPTINTTFAIDDQGTNPVIQTATSSDLKIINYSVSNASLQVGIDGFAGTVTKSSGQANSLAAISAIDTALSEVNKSSATLGALQNRFTAVISNLTAFSQSQTAAKSRIVDADFAAETAKLSKNQILQQAGTAMLAQANQLPSGILSLLKNG